MVTPLWISARALSDGELQRRIVYASCDSVGRGDIVRAHALTIVIATDARMGYRLMRTSSSLEGRVLKSRVLRVDETHSGEEVYGRDKIHRSTTLYIDLLSGLLFDTMYFMIDGTHRSVLRLEERLIVDESGRVLYVHEAGEGELLYRGIGGCGLGGELGYGGAGALALEKLTDRSEGYADGTTSIRTAALLYSGDDKGIGSGDVFFRQGMAEGWEMWDLAGGRARDQDIKAGDVDDTYIRDGRVSSYNWETRVTDLFCRFRCMRFRVENSGNSDTGTYGSPRSISCRRREGMYILWAGVMDRWTHINGVQDGILINGTDLYAGGWLRTRLAKCKRHCIKGVSIWVSRFWSQQSIQIGVVLWCRAHGLIVLMQRGVSGTTQEQSGSQWAVVWNELYWDVAVSTQELVSHGFADIMTIVLSSLIEGSRWYGYIKNRKKTIKNGQARTRELEEYKKKPKIQSRSQKSQASVKSSQNGQIMVNKSQQDPKYSI
ncbi:hypothetical protein Tco_0304202 [Tanacetum coccineum]